MNWLNFGEGFLAGYILAMILVFIYIRYENKFKALFIKGQVIQEVVMEDTFGKDFMKGGVI